MSVTVEDIEDGIVEIEAMLELGDFEAAHVYEDKLLWLVVEAAAAGKKNSKKLALALMKLHTLAKTKWYG